MEASEKKIRGYNFGGPHSTVLKCFGVYFWSPPTLGNYQYTPTNIPEEP